MIKPETLVGQRIWYINWGVEQPYVDDYDQQNILAPVLETFVPTKVTPWMGVNLENIFVNEEEAKQEFAKRRKNYVIYTLTTLLPHIDSFVAVGQIDNILDALRNNG